MKREGEDLLQGAIVLFIIIMIIVTAFGWRTCSRRGGTYVRGVIGMECVR